MNRPIVYRIMSYKEYLDKIKNIDEYSVTDENEEFVKWVMNLETENKQLKEQKQKAIDCIKDKINKSFRYDYGLDDSSYKDRLFTETVIELQVIANILQGKEDK